jgi:hypothetical protein
MVTAADFDRWVDPAQMLAPDDTAGTQGRGA